MLSQRSGLFENKWERVAEADIADERRIVEIAHGLEGAAGEITQQETIILIGVIVAHPSPSASPASETLGRGAQPSIQNWPRLMITALSAP